MQETVFRSTLRRWRFVNRAGTLALSAVLAVPLCTASAPQETVTALVSAADGSTDECQLLDTTVGLSTEAGRLDFRVRDVDSISFDGEPRATTITTRRGDVWRGRLAQTSLPQIRRGKRASLALHDPPLSRITLRHSEADAWIPREHARLLLRNGTQAVLDPTETRLAVRNALGTWQLPLGSAAVMTLRETDHADGITVLARFGAGSVEEFALATRGTGLSLRDTYGNSIAVPANTVRMILGRLGVQDTSHGTIPAAQGVTSALAATTFPASQRYNDAMTITTADGSRAEGILPLFVVELHTDMGDVPFASPCIRSVQPRDVGPRTSLTTVFGETFVGSLRPMTIRIPQTDPDGPPIRIPWSDGIRMSNAVPTVPRPAGWFTAHTVSGDAFFARFADDTARLRFRCRELRTDVAAKVSGVDRIAMDGTRAVIRMSDTSTYSGTFLSPRQDIVLLSTGTRHSIRWSDLLSVEQDGTLPPTPVTTPLLLRDPDRPSDTPAVTPGAAERVPDIAQPKKEEQGEESVTSVPDTAAEVELRTAFGRFKVAPDALRSVRGSARESLWHVTTRFGEVFTATRVSRNFLQRLSAMETNTARKSVSEWQLSTEPVCPPVEGELAWRLKSGSVFYAAITDESVRLVPSGGRGDSVEIPSDGIVSFTSEEPGIWILGTAAGPRRGTPDAGMVRVRLACNGDVADVRYGDIDRAQRSRIEELPPPLCFVPFATPAQEGSVLLPGGRFVMGRESGPGPDDEVPARPVAVSPFLMDACEVTRGQFAEFARQTGFRTDAERQSSRATWELPGFRQSQDDPVVNVTWNDAARYCNWRSRCAGLAPCYDDGERRGELVCDRLRNGFRLPTEAEWEYACRNGGETIPYPWGSASDPANAARNANFSQEKDSIQDGWLWTNPVKYFKPNRIGLFGMAGNAWEWCEDWYSERSYSALFALAVDDPCVTRADMAGLVSRAMRGGSFANSLDMLRCTGRGHGAPGAWANRVGFRCVRNAPR